MYDEIERQNFLMNLRLKVLVKPYQKLKRKNERIVPLREIDLDLIVNKPEIKRIRIGRERDFDLNDEIAPKIVLPFPTISKDHGELGFYFEKKAGYAQISARYFDKSTKGTWLCLDDPEFVEDPKYLFVNKNSMEIKQKVVLYLGATDRDYSSSIYQIDVEWE